MEVLLDDLDDLFRWAVSFLDNSERFDRRLEKEMFNELGKVRPAAFCVYLIVLMKQNRELELERVLGYDSFPRGLMHFRFSLTNSGWNLFGPRVIEISSFNIGPKIGHILLSHALDCKFHQQVLFHILCDDLSPSQEQLTSLISFPTYLGPKSRLDVVRLAMRNYEDYCDTLDHWTRDSDYQGILTVLTQVCTLNTIHFKTQYERYLFALVASYAPDQIKIPCGLDGSKMFRAIEARCLYRILDLLISGHCLPVTLVDQVDSSLSRILRMYHSPWNYQKPLFFLYGPNFISAIKTLILLLQVWMRKASEETLETSLPYLPAEMWFNIMAQLRREDYYVPSIHHTVFTTACENQLFHLYHISSRH